VGLIAHLMSVDSPPSSEKTQKTPGWQPTQSGLLADVEPNRCYFGGGDRREDLMLSSGAD